MNKAEIVFEKIAKTRLAKELLKAEALGNVADKIMSFSAGRKKT